MKLSDKLHALDKHVLKEFNYPQSKLAQPYQVLLKNEFNKHFPRYAREMTVVDKVVYIYKNPIYTINPDSDGVTDVINKIKKIIRVSDDQKIQLISKLTGQSIEDTAKYIKDKNVDLVKYTPKALKTLYK